MTRTSGSTTRTALIGVTSVLLVATFAGPSAAYQPPGRQQLVSVRADGSPATDWSTHPSISGDGRFVAFESRDALVSEDTNDLRDIYVRDLRTATTELISVGDEGEVGDAHSFMPEISADGRKVVFNSLAGNFGASDLGGQPHAFVHDRETRTTRVASVDNDGEPVPVGWSVPNHISGDGRFVVFTAGPSLVPDDTNTSDDIYIRDLVEGRTEIVSLANDGSAANHASNFGVPSFDGRYVVFMSAASNLVEGDTNGERNSQAGWDIFVRDRAAATTVRASLASNGQQANDMSHDARISADGNIVAFRSMATNLVPADDNRFWDVFVRDLRTGRTERVSVGSGGEQANSADPLGGGPSLALTPNGRYVGFVGWSSTMFGDDEVLRHLDPSVERVFVHDRATGTTEVVSVAEDGAPAGGYSSVPSLSADGRYVAFESSSNDLVDTGPSGCPFSSDEAACPGVIMRDRGPASGPAAIDVSVESGQVTVEGWGRVGSAAVTSAKDAEADGGDLAEHVGGEITAVELVNRPEVEDLLVSIELAGLPGVRSEIGGWPMSSTDGFLLWSGINIWCYLCSPPSTATPLVRYTARFSYDGVIHEARAVRVGNGAEAPAFSLHRCEPECEHVSDIGGSLGSTGEGLRIAIPRTALPSSEGAAVVSAVSVSTDVVAGPQTLPVDSVDLPPATLPEVRAELALAPAGTAEHEVDFRTRALLEEGRFNGTLPTTDLPPGNYDVWVRLCANECSAAYALVAVATSGGP